VIAVRQEDGGILIPKRAEGADGMLGDGMLPVYEGDPEFEAWDAWLKREEAETDGS
jgi:hypothetical protein